MPRSVGPNPNSSRRGQATRAARLKSMRELSGLALKVGLGVLEQFPYVIQKDGEGRTDAAARVVCGSLSPDELERNEEIERGIRTAKEALKHIYGLDQRRGS